MKRMGRREFVLLGSTGLGTLAIGGFVGCSSASSNGSETGDQELNRAKEDWHTAFSNAEDCWENLSTTIVECENAIASFETMVIKNPDTLKEFEALLEETKSIKNQHADKTIPDSSPSILEDTEELEELAGVYQNAADDLLLKKSEIIVFDPQKGEFNVVDKDGYSYQVSYDLSPSITVDTTEGKPGQVALYMDLSNCSVSVKNTTSGKKAPGILFDCAPLYSIDLFTDVVENVPFYFATFGALITPIELSSSTSLGDVKKLERENTYANPFDNDMQGGLSSSSPSDFGFISNLDIQAGEKGTASQSYQILAGKDFEVAESKTLFVGQAYTSEGSKLKLGEIAESYVDRFKKISGWAVYPRLAGWPSNTVYFAGSTNKSSDLGDDYRVYTYNPVEGVNQ